MRPEIILKTIVWTTDGLTTKEIARALQKAGIRITGKELIEALQLLIEDNHITLGTDRRWKLSHRIRKSSSFKASSCAEKDWEGAVSTDLFLTAVRFRIEPKISKASKDVLEPESIDPKQHLPPIKNLLKYYESTLRHDARGATKCFPDEHGGKFQLVSTCGSWWSDSETQMSVSCQTSNLPSSFREILPSHKDDAFAFGYPLEVIDLPVGKTIVPIFLFTCDQISKSSTLELDITANEAILNPEWLRECFKSERARGSEIQRCFQESAELGFEEQLSLLEELLATRIRGKLDAKNLADQLPLNKEGIFNCAAIVLPVENTFSKSAANDLKRLSQLTDDQLFGSALHTILNHRTTGQVATPVLCPLQLTENQFNATKTALSEPLTVITGPPGTGKSQVISAIVASALAANKTVLFSSKNHQAVSAVQERLQTLVPEHPILVRAYHPETGIDTSFLKIVKEIIAKDHAISLSGEDLHKLETAISLDQVRGLLLQLTEEQSYANYRLSELATRRSAINTATGKSNQNKAGLRQQSTKLGVLRRILSFFLAKSPPPSQPKQLPTGASLSEINAAYGAQKTKLQEITVRIDEIQHKHGDFTDITNKVLSHIGEQESKKGLFSALALSNCQADPQVLEKLNNSLADFELSGQKTPKHMDLQFTETVLQARPIWAVTSLAGPSRIPLHARLFDLVIFDEASQCDIGSALPLLARGKNAVVVGDPNQLTFIPSLSLAKERALLKASGLEGPGLGQYLQSKKSLFDFCAARPNAKRLTLTTQFRSCGDIVGYLNDEFYDDQLIAVTDENKLPTPKDRKPGIHWSDVKGHTTYSRPGGPTNSEEATAIAKQLSALALDSSFTGTIGVVTPFNNQVALLKKTISDVLKKANQSNLIYRVDTVDRFQGGECDIILFSPVVSKGAHQSTITFLQKERRRFNVAVSRARTIFHVYGDLEFAQESSIHHLKRLAHFATNKRRNQSYKQQFDSLWERRIDTALRARGLEPLPQYPILGYSLDFALQGKDGIWLDLEVDGKRWHTDSAGNRKSSDILRDQRLKAAGWKVRRFWVHELEQDMESCLDRVQRDLAG